MSTPTTAPSGTDPISTPPLPEIPGVAVEHEFYDLPAGRFHVARAGDRSLPAILLVHGFPQHWWCWNGVVQALAAEAHLVMPDLRGAGWSAVPTDRGAYKKRELAGDLRALLDAMEIDEIAVVGHDWGGFVSQLLTLDAPERVRRLLALSITAVIPTKRPPLRSLLRMYYQLAFAAPGSTFLMQRGNARFAASMRADVQRPDAFTADDARFYASFYRDPARAKGAQSTYRSFIGGDGASIFASTRGQRLAVPTRFVFARHDGYVPWQFSVGADRVGDQVEVQVQDRTGHFLPDEDPAFVADQIREFVLPHAQPLG